MKDRKKFHALVLTAALVLTVWIAMSCGREGPEDPPDTLPPTITATSPYYNEQNVPLNASVNVTFNEAMSPASITDKSLMLLQANSAVAGTASCNGETAVFKPAANLNQNTLYTVRVSVDVKDAAGNALVVPYEYSVTTGTTVATGTHTIQASAGPNGSISPSGSLSVDDGRTSAFVITPGPGYHLVTPVGGTCGGTLSGMQYTTNPVTGDCTVAASFSADAPSPVYHAVTASAGPNGEIQPLSASVQDGKTYSFAVIPGTGYQIDTVTGCGGSLSGTTYRTGPITGPCAVTAAFKPLPPPPVVTHTIRAEADGTGTITPSGNVPVPHGEDQSFKIETDGVFIISSIKVDGSDIDIGHYEKSFTYTFFNVDRDHEIIAKFKRFWQIDASAEGNGTISPSGVVNVEEGGSQAFAMVPGIGSVIADVLVDQYSVGPIATFSFTNVTSNHSIWASFLTLTPLRYTVTATAAGSGSIDLSSATVDAGATQEFRLAPAEGFHVVTPVGGTCGGTLAESILVYTTEPVTKDCTVEVVFEADQPAGTGDGTVIPISGEEAYYINLLVVEQAGEGPGESPAPENVSWKTVQTKRL